MSASNEWTEWHLTPAGWVRGSERTDYQKEKRVAPPGDRVQTCKYTEFLSSSFSSLDKDVSILWESDNKDAVNSLINKFGECPASL